MLTARPWRTEPALTLARVEFTSLAKGTRGANQTRRALWPDADSSAAAGGVSGRAQVQMLTDKQQRRAIMRPLPVRSSGTGGRGGGSGSRSNEERRARMEKDQLMDMLFKLFERQTLWNFKQLMAETNQPAVWLKEVLMVRATAPLHTRPTSSPIQIGPPLVYEFECLPAPPSDPCVRRGAAVGAHQEVCRYHKRGPNADKWEVKPEYKQSAIAAPPEAKRIKTEEGS